MGLEKIASDFLHETWGSKSSRGDKSTYDVFSENAIIDSPLGYQKGSAYLEKTMSSWFEAFPDVIATVEQVHGYKNSVVCNWRARGTHHGNFKGVPPTGKNVLYNGETVFIFGDKEEIVHYVAKLDMSDILRQLDDHFQKDDYDSQEKLDHNKKLLASELRKKYTGLTQREIECTSLFISGFSSKQIGLMLSVSHRTVEVYLEKARMFLCCNSRIQMTEKFLSEQTFFMFQDFARLLVRQYSRKLFE